MKKLISMMLMLCAIITFSACSSDDDAPVNPVSSVRVPSSAKIGDEVTVQGSGFAAGQTLYLQQGTEAVDVNARMSASGATFTVPYTLNVGTAKVVLHNGNDNWILGDINLTEPANPISSMKMPTQMAIGSTQALTAIGFQDGDKLKFEPVVASKEMMSSSAYVDGVVTGDSLVITVPSSYEEGDYSVSLVRGKNEWSLGQAYVYQARRIESITISGNQMMRMYAGMLGLTDDDMVLNLKYNDNGMLTAIETNAANVGWNITYDGNVASCDNYTFTLDENNRVVSSTALEIDYEIGEYVTATYNWNYDANGYLVSVKKAGVEEDANNLLNTYENGNFVDTRNVTNETEVVYTKFAYNNEVRACPGTMEPAYLINTFAWIVQRDHLFLGMLIGQNMAISAYVPNQISAYDYDQVTGEENTTPCAIASSFANNTLTMQTSANPSAAQSFFANKISVKYANK